MSVIREPHWRPAVLVINPDLPKYGAKAHEFCNTIGLAENFSVGLVTQLVKASEWVDVRRLESHGVSVYVAEAADGIREGGARERGAPSGASPSSSPHPRLRAFLRSGYGFMSLFFPRPSEVYDARRTLANLAGPMRRALAERRWDKIVIIQSRSAEWLDWLPPHTPTLLVLHDVRTMVWRRQFQVAAGLARRFRALVTAAKYWSYERHYFRRAAGVICLTEVDARLVRRWFGTPPLAVVPLPVDSDYFRPMPPVAAGPPSLLFPGMMDHYPNIDAALWFVREIYPRLRRAHPQLLFVVAGMRPPREILALDGRDGITVTGEVPDMRPFFRAASVVVVPLRIGSGARNKILEAWACGRPVVSTTVGAEGLDFADGRDLSLADDPDTFAAAVGALLEQAGRRAALVEGGFAAVRAHAPARVAARYREAVAAAGPKLPAGARGPMRIAIDMRWMTPGSAGGLEQQARALVETLIAIDRVNRYTLIVPSECRADFDLRGRRNFRIVCRNSPAADARRLGRALARRLGAALGGSAARWPDRWALGDLHRLDCELAYSFTGFINPELWELRHVIALPDIQHEFFPEFFSPAVQAERRRLFDQSLGRAAHICAMSEYTRRTLIERLGIPTGRISVTQLAAGAAYRPPLAGSQAATAETLGRRYGLEPRTYFFFPAHSWHHKNHATAIRALASLRDRFGVTMTLACAGSAREAQPELERLTGELGLTKQVRFLGYVEHADMPRLYQGAAALVFPSRFEGFGMPVLEAMACGTPVICADATSLPEVAGEAALCLPPLDVEGWADAMHRIVTDDGLRQRLIERGFERQGHFSWRRHALETLAVFAAVYHGQVQSAGPVGREAAVEVHQ